MQNDWWMFSWLEKGFSNPNHNPDSIDYQIGQSKTFDKKFKFFKINIQVDF
jgi:hypothetical protein